MSRRSRKTQEWVTGDCIEIPLQDGSSGTAQILGPHEFGGFVPLVFFDLRFTPSDSRDVTRFAQSRAIGVMSVERLPIDTGEWKVIGNFRVTLDAKDWPNASQRANNDWLGAVFQSSPVAEAFLEACWGLIPWNSMFDPDCFLEFLLDPKKMPSTARVVPK